MKSSTFYVVPNCYRIPNPKCHVLMLAFPWSQGFRKYFVKSAHKGFLKTFLSLQQGGTYTVKTGLFSISVPQTVPLQIPDMLI